MIDIQTVQKIADPIGQIHNEGSDLYWSSLVQLGKNLQAIYSADGVINDFFIAGKYAYLLLDYSLQQVDIRQGTIICEWKVTDLGLKGHFLPIIIKTDRNELLVACGNCIVKFNNL